MASYKWITVLNQKETVQRSLVKIPTIENKPVGIVIANEGQSVKWYLPDGQKGTAANFHQAKKIAEGKTLRVQDIVVEGV